MTLYFSKDMAEILREHNKVIEEIRADVDYSRAYLENNEDRESPIARRCRQILMNNKFLIQNTNLLFEIPVEGEFDEITD